MTLDVCFTHLETEKRCMELRVICPTEYVFAAVFAPDWPKNKEYVLTCSSLYYAPLPLGLATFVLVTFIVGVCCFKKYNARFQTRTSSEEAPILNTRRNRPTTRRTKRTWHQRASRYGALHNK